MVAMNCPNTRWVLAGYSQGAMVMSQSIKYFKPDEIIYVSLVGDPELYLPEGWGLFPSACFDGDLSRYRVNVSNCRTKRGSLGYRKPYELEGFEGKYGLWCNNDDYICGSSRNLLNNGGHLRYGSDKTFSWIFKIVDSKIVASSRKRRAQLAPASTKDFTQEIVDLKNVEIMAPKIVKVFKKGPILLINLSENEKPAEAKYYLISINSFPVALVDAKEKILTISDIEFDELVSVVISYVDSGMNVGDEAVITLRDDNGVLKLEEYIEEDIGDIGSFEKEFEVLDEPKNLSDILDEIDAEKNVENIGGIAIKEQQYGDMAVDSRKRDFVAVSGMGGRENISSNKAKNSVLLDKNGGVSIKEENKDSFG